MPIVRGIVVGVVGALLTIAVAACQVASANPSASASDSQIVAATSTRQPAGNVVWGRVPYCNCFADSATVKVAEALKKANLTVSLKEQSPRDGWLYFVVTFDTLSATQDQVTAAMKTGGAEVLNGPP